MCKIGDARVSIIKTFPVFAVLSVCTIIPIFSLPVAAIMKVIHYGNINGVYIISSTAIILLSNIKSHERFTICLNELKIFADLTGIHGHILELFVCLLI